MNKQAKRTRRTQYDEYLMSAYHKTCKDVAVMGFEFPTEERQRQFHYGIMEHAVDRHMLYDGAGFRARVVASKDNADALRAIAESFDAKEFKVMLEEEL